MTPPSTALRAGRYDAIVIGGGINGLTCAAHLAKNGIRTVLVEQRASVGGCATESELAPGFTVPTLSHATGPIRGDVIAELQLDSHGLSFTDTSSHVSALLPDGRALVVWDDPGRTAEGLRAWSAKDAAAWPAFQQTMNQLGALVGGVFLGTPPSVDAPTTRDVFGLMQTLRSFRSLPKADQWRLLRWGPMAVADLVSEVIETELLRAVVAADGVFGAMLGPWSAGSGLQLLLTSANRSLAGVGGRIGERRADRVCARARTRRGSSWRGNENRRGRKAHRGQRRSRNWRDAGRR